MDEQQPTNPWVTAEIRYPTGQEVQGVVTRITQFGVFVQVEPGLEGIVYAFELGPGPSALTGFTPGQEVQLYVKSIDTGKRRLELGLSNETMPGLLEARTLPPAARRKTPPDEPFLSGSLLLPELPLNSHRQGPSTCPACQRGIQTFWKYCIYCGKTLQRRCSACGSAQPDLPDARYCYECGQPLL